MAVPTSSAGSSPPLERFIRDKASLRAIGALAAQLKRGQLRGAYPVASETARVLRAVISAARFSDLDDLVAQIKAAGRILQKAQPREQSVGNITRRVLHLLREEAKAAALEAEPESGLDSLAPSPRSRFANLSLSDSTPGPSPTTSNAESAILRRPELQPLRHDSAFGHGSFSISDLVAAGAMASVAPTPSASGTVSGASTPGGRALTRSGSGFFNQLYRISTPGVAEDPDAEAEAEAAAEGAKDGEEDEEGSGDGAGEEEDDEDEAGPSTSGKGAGRSTGACVNAYQLKPLLIQAIQELIDELETVHLNVAKDAKDHVHSGEVILTLGKSRTVELFLKAAAKDRKFTVIVAETGPSYAGHSTARVLSLAGISTLLVPDSSIFALMPRVSKVVLGAHAVLANGGLLGAAGSSATALAAGAHSTPLVVLAGLFKVCPEWGWVETSSSRGGIVGGGSGPPAQVLDFGQDGCVGGASLVEQVEVVNPLWDYVGPESVDVFITNVGEHPPSYVYRLIKENYDEADLML